MKKGLLLVALFVINTLSAQILKPVNWETSVEKISDSEYVLITNAYIDAGWHLYAQDVPENGPIPTSFIYEETKDYSLVGKTEEKDGKIIDDPVFGMKIKFFKDKATFKQKIKLNNTKLSTIKAEVEYMVCDDERCLPPDVEQLTFILNKEAALQNKETTVTLTENDIKKSEALNLNITGWSEYEKETVSKKSNFSIFILGFVGGLIALLTPCVFPMIPLTVSFFTKGNDTKKKRGASRAILYGFFIFLIYVLLSIPFHLIDSLDPEILNNISTNVVLNIIFFLVFLFFAFSFFGYYELTLPASWSTALDNKASKVGGVVGVFLMALTLAIVSFSCTGPILGGLLGSTTLATGNIATKLSMGMAGFGLALALPFSVFAMFPNWLNSLPKSGGWLNTVKVVLGFIELALAFKFLSNADLVEHWGILKREIFIAIWVIITLLTAIYLFGKIKFPHDSPIQKLSKGRIGFALLFVAITVYLIPGLTNTKYANLKLLSGIAPPMFYSVYNKPSDCPLGLTCYKDLDEGLAAAKKLNKPIILDFTGWACVNCRKMEEHVWSTSTVYKKLSNDFVLISLYVDDRKELPENEQFKYLKPGGKVKTIKTIGDKWSTLQTINFNNNSQPYYVLLDHNMKLLNHPIAYTPDANEYATWLTNGLRNFKKLSLNKKTD